MQPISDESNDVVIVEKAKNIPTSFKNIFAQSGSEAPESGNEATESGNEAENDADSDAQNAKKNKTKTDGNGTVKRYDWDMFAEQDIDSNFDVSTLQVNPVIFY